MRSWMIGIFFGILAIAYTPQLPSYIWLAVSAAPLLLALMWYQFGNARRHRQWPAAAGIGLGVLMGVLWATYFAHQSLQSRLAEACNRKPLDITGQVVSLVRTSAIRVGVQRQQFEFIPDGSLPDQCGHPRKLLLSYYGEHSLTAGQRWRFGVALRRPWGSSNPGSFNLQSWFALSGIDAVGNVRRDAAQLLDNASGYATLHHRLREKVSARLDALSASSSVVAVLKAITVADKSRIDATLWQVFQQYGVNHLLVISGLHIGLAASLGYFFGVLLARLSLIGSVLIQIDTIWRQRLFACFTVAPQAASLLVAAAYAALAGFSLSTQRALVMLACFCLASMLGRTSSGFNNLLLSGVVLSLWNPLAVIGSGFWLSFGAVGALLWFARWQGGREDVAMHATAEQERGHGVYLARIFGPVGSRLALLFKVHVYMSLVMVPLGGLWFGGVSLVAAAANFIAIPLLGFWVVPSSLAGALLALFDNRFDLYLWQLAGWPLAHLIAPAVEFAGQKSLYWLVASYPSAIVVALGAVACLCLPLRLRTKLPLLVLFMPMVLPLLPKVTETRFTVLDVGQGTAAVFTQGGQALVYDTGGGTPGGFTMAQSVLLPYLRHRGVLALDTLVISHGDTDHSAGLSVILEEVPVLTVKYGQGVTAPVNAEPCLAGQSWQWRSGAKFKFISPGPMQKNAIGFTSTNDNSCVLLIDTGGTRLLLAGDIGKNRERDLIRRHAADLKSDVLLVSHHGSRSSTSGAWLNSVDPEIAIVSSGYASRFGHPHQEVVERLEGRGVSVRSTALEGALELTFAGDTRWSVTAHREGLKPWWM